LAEKHLVSKTSSVIKYQVHAQYTYVYVQRLPRRRRFATHALDGAEIDEYRDEAAVAIRSPIDFYSLPPKIKTHLRLISKLEAIL
jgi:hypothetical protein